MNVDLDHFSQELARIQLRWKELSKYVQANPDQPSHLLWECLEEMGMALEELYVAEEELLAKNAEISEKNEALVFQIRRYQDLFEFAPDGYLETDIYGTIREANRQAAQLFNRSTNFLQGFPIANLVTPDYRRVLRFRINRMAALQRVQDWEVCCLRQPEQKFDAALTVETVPGPQGPTALRWLIRDVTEIKRAHAELQTVKLQNLELAESDRLKQQFLANVSHELRTPLNSIIGFSSLLQPRMREHPDPKCGDMVNRIQRSGRNLMLLIQELLDYSKLKGGHVVLRPTSFDLCSLITETLEELTYLAEQKSIKLATNLPDTLDITNDTSRMRQIIVNLVSNAIKFTDRGSVTVKLQAVSPDRFVLVVQDTGVGIDLADQTHIFEEFWQVNQDPKLKSVGTGLGLAIVNSIVRSMEGTIALESTLNLGTTFRVELPRWIQTERS